MENKAPNDALRPVKAHPKNRDELKKAIFEADLGKYWTSIEASIRDDVLVDVTPVEESQVPCGTSKMGGLPDFPPCWEWPRAGEDVPLSFVSQINCAEASRHDRSSLLPKDGILYFFAPGSGDWEERGMYGYAKSDVGRFKVLYFDGDLSSLQRTPYPDPDRFDQKKWEKFLADHKKYGITPPRENFYCMTGVYPCCGVSFMASCTPVTFWESSIRQQLSLDGEEREDCEDWRYIKILFPDRQLLPYKLLGNADCPEHDVTLFGEYAVSCDPENPQWIQMCQNAEDWILLFQIPSGRGTEMLWGGATPLYFVIYKQDLAEKRFDRIWASAQ